MTAQPHRTGVTGLLNRHRLPAEYERRRARRALRAHGRKSVAGPPRAQPA